VKEGTASQTARSVAARRLEYERVPASYGDPEADEALAADVADGYTPRPGGMDDYIRARTAFFDRVVVTALDRGVKQVVIGGAGYDGRALRYAKPDVRWFEIDHPATQADKLERIERLGLPARHISFIPADFAVDPIADPLRVAGLNPARAALFLLEGVAVYLDQPVIERVLTEFRQITPAASALAISISMAGVTSVTRARFQERVASLGEPYRTVLTLEETRTLLSSAGWKLRDPTDGQRRGGLLLAHATISPDNERLLAPPDTSTPARASAPVETMSRARPASVTSEQAARLPLSALLSQALVAYTIEADNEAERRLPHRTSLAGLANGSPRGAPWLTSLLMYANCLRHLPDQGITIAELRARARTGTNLDGMRRWRYVTYSPNDKPPKPDALIRPTSWGIEARGIWQAVTADVEDRWRDRLGEQKFTALRAALADLAAHQDPALPDCLPILGYGLRIRRDPTTEGSTDAPADLPLWALLSRPLVAFAAQYEEEPGPSLAIGADILRVLTADGVYTKDIPALAGVSKESVAMAMGVLAKSGLVVEGPDPAGSRFRLTRLTAEGVAARDEYPALAADIERDWRTRHGAATITAVRRALEPLVAGDPPRLFAGMAPTEANWRAMVPGPTALPHFPMTLHRGGYPDGA
jgi:methyltransferase (TIGR00027 family)